MNMDVLAPLLVSIDTTIQNQAHEVMSAVDTYAKHVFSGGDVADLPRQGERRWSPSLATPYAQQIVNAYRESEGTAPNPYSPGSTHYKLFDRLLRAFDSGEAWVPAKVLSRGIMGSRAETYLKQNHLKPWGWTLEKEKIDGKVHFALAKYSEVTGKVTA